MAENDDSNFQLTGGTKISGWREKNSDLNPDKVFPFQQYRDAMSRAKSWPSKTTDSYRFSCEFIRSDWKHFRQRLNFFDFPGERIADVAIAAHSDFDKWSDHMFRHFNSNLDYKSAMAGYYQEINTDQPTAEKLLAGYRLSLAGLILGYKPLISPSVFLLDREGQAVTPGTERELASSQICGLDNDSQFSPLPEDFRKSHPEIVKQFTKFYRQYRKQLVLPLFEQLVQGDTLVILIDIPSLLAGGVGRYNDNRQIVLDLIETLQKDTSLSQKLKRIIKFWNKPLRKIAFVASKSDLVLAGDIVNGKLQSLLKQMNARAKSLIPDAEVKWFTCSACQSTTQEKDGKSLKGKLAYNNPEKEPIEFEVSELPESWPESWQPNDYHFYSVYPETAQNYQLPPKHLGLDRILDFMINS